MSDGARPRFCNAASMVIVGRRSSVIGHRNTARSTPSKTKQPGALRRRNVMAPTTWTWVSKKKSSIIPFAYCWSNFVRKWHGNYVFFETPISTTEKLWILATCWQRADKMLTPWPRWCTVAAPQQYPGSVMTTFLVLSWQQFDNTLMMCWWCGGNVSEIFVWATLLRSYVPV